MVRTRSTAAVAVASVGERVTSAGSPKSISEAVKLRRRRQRDQLNNNITEGPPAKTAAAGRRKKDRSGDDDGGGVQESVAPGPAAKAAAAATSSISSGGRAVDAGRKRPSRARAGLAAVSGPDAAVATKTKIQRREGTARKGPPAQSATAANASKVTAATATVATAATVKAATAKTATATAGTATAAVTAATAGMSLKIEAGGTSGKKPGKTADSVLQGTTTTIDKAVGRSRRTVAKRTGCDDEVGSAKESKKSGKLGAAGRGSGDDNAPGPQGGRDEPQAPAKSTAAASVRSKKRPMAEDTSSRATKRGRKAASILSSAEIEELLAVDEDEPSEKKSLPAGEGRGGPRGRTAANVAQRPARIRDLSPVLPAAAAAVASKSLRPEAIASILLQDDDDSDQYVTEGEEETGGGDDDGATLKNRARSAEAAVASDAPAKVPIYMKPSSTSGKVAVLPKARRGHNKAMVEGHNITSENVYDMTSYGAEEFGDLDKVLPRKKVRQKKASQAKRKGQLLLPGGGGFKSTLRGKDQARTARPQLQLPTIVLEASRSIPDNMVAAAIVEEEDLAGNNSGLLLAVPDVSAGKSDRPPPKASGTVSSKAMVGSVVQAAAKAKMATTNPKPATTTISSAEAAAAAATNETTGTAALGGSGSTPSRISCDAFLLPSVVDNWDEFKVTSVPAKVAHRVQQGKVSTPIGRLAEAEDAAAAAANSNTSTRKALKAKEEDRFTIQNCFGFDDDSMASDDDGPQQDDHHLLARTAESLAGISPVLGLAAHRGGFFNSTAATQIDLSARFSSREVNPIQEDDVIRRLELPKPKPLRFTAVVQQASRVEGIPQHKTSASLLMPNAASKKPAGFLQVSAGDGIAAPGRKRPVVDNKSRKENRVPVDHRPEAPPAVVGEEEPAVNSRNALDLINRRPSCRHPMPKGTGRPAKDKSVRPSSMFGKDKQPKVRRQPVEEAKGHQSLLFSGDDEIRMEGAQRGEPGAVAKVGPVEFSTKAYNRTSAASQYSRYSLQNASTASSFQRKYVTKKEKAMEQWQSLQSSHFEEIDDVELTFV